jgi:hypothetical protein
MKLCFGFTKYISLLSAVCLPSVRTAVLSALPINLVKYLEGVIEEESKKRKI